MADEKPKNVMFRLPADRYAALDEAAAHNGLTPGSAASMVVQAWLDRRQAPLRRKDAPAAAAGQGQADGAAKGDAGQDKAGQADAGQDDAGQGKGQTDGQDKAPPGPTPPGRGQTSPAPVPR